MKCRDPPLTLTSLPLPSPPDPRGWAILVFPRTIPQEFYPAPTGIRKHCTVQVPRALWLPPQPCGRLRGCLQLPDPPGASRVEQRSRSRQGCVGRVPGLTQGGQESPPTFPDVPTGNHGMVQVGVTPNPIPVSMGAPSSSCKGRKERENSQIPPGLCNCPGASMRFLIPANLSWKAA